MQAVVGQSKGEPRIIAWRSTYVCPKRWPWRTAHDKVVHTQYRPSGDELNEYK